MVAKANDVSIEAAAAGLSKLILAGNQAANLSVTSTRGTAPDL